MAKRKSPPARKKARRSRPGRRMMSEPVFVMPPPMVMPEPEPRGPNPLMVLVVLLMLGVGIWMWYTVGMLWTSRQPTASASASGSAAAMLESFAQNRTYMTALAAVFTLVFLFMLYNIMD